MTALRSPRQRIADEQGLALIIALLAVALLMALGLALVLTTMTETRIAATYRDAVETLQAADAAVERVMVDMLTLTDWDGILDGSVRSAFVDGGPGGVRRLPDGRALNLTQATNVVRCGQVSACGDADLDAITEHRPWGRNNPRWQLYAYGPLSALLPGGSIGSPVYVVVWMADDPSESDDDPLADGLDTAGCAPGSPACVNHGQGIITMLAHAYGPGGAVRAVEVTLALNDASSGARMLTWRELR